MNGVAMWSIVAFGMLVLPGLVTASPPEATTVCDRVIFDERRADIPSQRELEDEIESRFRGRLENSGPYLETLLIRLHDPDALERARAIARLRYGRGLYRKPEWNDDRVVEQLLQLGRRETQVQVFEGVVRALGKSRGTEGLTELLTEALRCDGDEPFLHAMLSASSRHPDPALVEPLMSLWRSPASERLRDPLLSALAASGDSSTVSAGLDALAAGHYFALPFLKQTAKTEEVPLLVAAFHENRDRSKFPTRAMLSLIASLRGTEAREFLEREFKKVATDEEKRFLAAQVLRSQLEPYIPSWTESDRKACVPYEEVRARQLPYLQRELERLTHRRNDKYWPIADWRAEGATEVVRSLAFAIRARSPVEQVMHWRRILGMLVDPSDMNREVILEDGTVELARALARRASSLATTDAEQALRDANEAIDLAAGTKTLGSHIEKFESVKRRLLRLAGHKECAGRVVAVGDVAGTYTVSSGFQGARLSLHSDRTFERENWTDAIDLCTGGRWRDPGRFHIEGEYIVLAPEPMLTRVLAGADLGPEVYAIVQWGSERYLVSETQLPYFCIDYNRREAPTFWGSYRSGDDDPITDEIPVVPCEWKEWLLSDPVVAVVEAVTDESCLRVSTEQASRLKPGMWLFGVAPSAAGTWVIEAVDSSSARACPRGPGSRAAVGSEVSTKLQAAERRELRPQR